MTNMNEIYEMLEKLTPNEIKMVKQYLWNDNSDFEITDGVVLEEYTGDDEDVIIPDFITTIKSSAFPSFSEVSSITIPDSVVNIGNAFSENDCLREIKFGKGVKTIGTEAFSGCSQLCNITVDKDNPYYRVQDGILYSLKDNKLDTLIVAPKNLRGKVIIPEGVTKICDLSFQYCSNITNVVIGKNVKSIGVWAFSECENLQGVTLSDSVETIDMWAFNECTSLTTVKFGKGLKRIGKVAFAECIKFSELDLPEGLEEIEDAAFVNCSSLNNITIPKSVQRIGERVFEHCNNLSSLSIPSHLKEYFKDINCEINTI